MTAYRHYDLDEIDRMRTAISTILDREADGRVEDQLRTYMMNGTSPQSLEQEADLAERRRKWPDLYATTEGSNV